MCKHPENCEDSVHGEYCPYGRARLNEFIQNDTFSRFRDINEFRIEVMRLWNRMRAGELTADLTDKTVTVLAILLDWIDEESGQDEAD